MKEGYSIHHKISNGDSVDLTEGNQIRDFLDVSIAAKIIANIAISTKQGD